MKNSGQIILGILGAAAAGVIVGMLVAPENGKDLRKNIKNSAGDLANKLGDLLAKGKEQYNALRSRVEEEVEDVKDEVRNQANEVHKRAKA